MFIWTKNEGIVLPISLFLIIATGILVGILLKNKSQTIKLIPIQIISAVIIILEIVKIILAIKQNSFSTWSIPLHFCSTFLFWLPLASFARGKIQQFGKSISFATSMMFVFLFYFNPGSIIGGACDNIFASFGAFHTYFYHHTIILFLVFMLTLNLYTPQKFDFLKVDLGLIIYATFAITFGHILNTNYCNVLYSNIPFMESLRVNAGQILYTIVLVSFGLLLGFMINYPYYIVCNLISRKKLVSQKSKKEENI